jgi:predicted nucleic acid-binding Zn ribbon protein
MVRKHQVLRTMDEHSPKRVDGPQSLGDVVTRLVALRGYGQPGGQRELARLWRDAAGPDIERHTRVIGLRKGSLLIGVGNAALLSELAAFHKHDLLEKVQEASQDAAIRDLKFRLRGDLNVGE